MLRTLLFLILLAQTATAQRLLTVDDAVNLALANAPNLKGAQLAVKQQELLLPGAADIAAPQITAEVTPYEPMTFGIQQSFSLPAVYRNRHRLQTERIRLAELQLRGSEQELKREVRNSYLQLQFVNERLRLLHRQDSIYTAIRLSSERFFAAGQINKLEELTATTQSDRVRNELARAEADLRSELELFRFHTGLSEPIEVNALGIEEGSAGPDTVTGAIQLRILEQQVSLTQQELKLQKDEQGPQFYAGPLFPTTRERERAFGFQAGVSLPIWHRQNRSRIAAAKTAIEEAQARQDLERSRMEARLRQANVNLERERQSLIYYRNTALPQARALMDVARRLFAGGELNYVESLRNLAAAFEIMNAHIDTQRSYGEALIEWKYLNGTL